MTEDVAIIVGDSDDSDFSDSELESPGEEFEDNPCLSEQTSDSFDSLSECSTDLEDAIPSHLVFYSIL